MDGNVRKIAFAQHIQHKYLRRGRLTSIFTLWVSWVFHSGSMGQRLSKETGWISQIPCWIFVQQKWKMDTAFTWCWLPPRKPALALDTRTLQSFPGSHGLAGRQSRASLSKCGSLPSLVSREGTMCTAGHEHSNSCLSCGNAPEQWI